MEGLHRLTLSCRHGAHYGAWRKHAILVPAGVGRVELGEGLGLTTGHGLATGLGLVLGLVLGLSYTGARVGQSGFTVVHGVVLLVHRMVGVLAGRM